MSQKLVITKEASSLFSWRKAVDFSESKSNGTIEEVVQATKEAGKKLGIKIRSVTSLAPHQHRRIGRVELEVDYSQSDSRVGELDHGYVTYEPPHKQSGRNARIIYELDVRHISLYDVLNSRIIKCMR